MPSDTLSDPYPDRFRLLMDALMLVSGLTMLYTAFR